MRICAKGGSTWKERFFKLLLKDCVKNNLLTDSRYVSVEEQLGIFLYAI
jgi:hypothetical protein